MTNARSNARSIAQTDANEQCTYVRTDERTYVDGFSPTRDTSSSVTRTRTYGDSSKLSKQARWARGERTARTPENLAAIRELHEDGLSDAAIARTLSLHAKTVWKARNDMGLPVNQPSTLIDEMAVLRAVNGDPPATLTSAETTEAVRILTQRGHTTAETARRLRVTTRTVTRHRIKTTQENAA